MNCVPCEPFTERCADERRKERKKDRGKKQTCSLGFCRHRLLPSTSLLLDAARCVTARTSAQRSNGTCFQLLRAVARQSNPWRGSAQRHAPTLCAAKDGSGPFAHALLQHIHNEWRSWAFPAPGRAQGSSLTFFFFPLSCIRRMTACTEP